MPWAFKSSPKEENILKRFMSSSIECCLKKKSVLIQSLHAYDMKKIQQAFPKDVGWSHLKKLFNQQVLELICAKKTTNIFQVIFISENSSLQKYYQFWGLNFFCTSYTQIHKRWLPKFLKFTHAYSTLLHDTLIIIIIIIKLPHKSHNLFKLQQFTRWTLNILISIIRNTCNP